MPENSSIISISTEIMGGTPVFLGTRVPIQTLFDYLEAGESIDDFLEGFPTVSREQIIALLEEAKKQLFSRIAIVSFAVMVTRFLFQPF
ncbi:MULTISPECIES: DUF433 domain-containing protein [Planktothrix]|uniref:DUF433 domain-containing protein n=1 Tax=Planktothrix rubescens CCAP 1459/22 TaxID=329571 RepID=A0A6J7ZSW0_PLARU|nr:MULTISPECIES: DUF433 domain-containing protein [Planktothrix]CAC5345450.1 conserved hypothetical protein [Planktothrix rubescens NIVA-CYA 18]CAD5958694.1 hypothetical protein PCC7821_03019 [Planktothrix rubescens NIVA-CYA 18]